MLKVEDAKRKAYTVFRVVLGALAAVLFFGGIILLFEQYRAVNSSVRNVATKSLRQEREYRVLFISSYSQTHFSVPLQWNGIDDELTDQGIVVDTEYMDTKNHADDRTTELFARQLAHKMESVSYDALIVGDDPALRFADEHREDLFQGLPVVFLGVNDLGYAEQVHADGWATGIPEESNVADVFHTAAGLFPESNKFVCIVDSSTTGQGDRVQVEGIVDQFPGYGFEFVNTSELTKDELTSKVAALRDDSIIFELDAFDDVDGNVYTIDDMCRLLAENSSRPIFRASTGGVGNGALGGGFLDFESFGRQAADMTIQILNGTRPEDIPLAYNTQTSYVFDANQMKQFKLKTRDLPPRTTILNGSQPFVERYRDIALPAELIVLGFVCVIVALVLSAQQARGDTERLRKNEEQLVHQLYYDGLTGLVNRNGLFKQDTSAYKTAVVMNIDNFKVVNERYGHPSGDRMLKALASRIASIPDAKAARIGGDQFLLLLRESIENNPEAVGRLREQLSEILVRPYPIGNQSVDATVSLGLSSRREGDDSLDGLLTAAELALFDGRKVQHQGAFQVFDDHIKEELDERTAMVEDLQRAVRDKTFRVLLQPQVVTETREVYGFEALCRFDDNKYYPDEFFPVAEETGLVIELDRIVTEKVVQQIAEWKRQGRDLPVVSINYSARQLRDTSYGTFLRQLLTTYGIPMDRIKIEITERSIFADQERSAAFFQNVHKMGMEISLDDFGTGYSSITAMTKLPVDFIKYDKSLIDEYLVKGKLGFILNLTKVIHSLGKKIVAEGVETADQYDLCKVVGIDQIQGYYFSRPLPPDQAIEASFK